MLKLNTSYIESLRLIKRNHRGWTTDRQLLVIESDDWGSIRTSSREAYDTLLEKGYPVDQCAFNRYDRLESDEDVLSLKQILENIIDYKGKPACMTLNYIMANPDFDAITRANFDTYIYETVAQTYAQTNESRNVLEEVRSGIKKGVFKPQFHGREHVNVHNWMNALKNSNPQALDAFKVKMFTSSNGNKSDCRMEFLDAFGSLSKKEYNELQSSIKEGMILFENTFGFKSESVIAPCYIWDDQVEKIWDNVGLKFIQSGISQMVPNHEILKYTIKKHFVGQKNKLGQVYLMRNVVFEPATDPRIDWVSKCFKEIQWAFRLKKPAIISTHRLNYMGGLSIENRENGLLLLKQLLESVILKYPEVEFMSSDTLGKIILN